MADEIMVNYASMANGAQALTTAANGFESQLNRMQDAANQVRATWSAESQAAFDARARQIGQRIQDIRQVQVAFSQQLNTHSDQTASLDRNLAQGFAG